MMQRAHRTAAAGVVVIALVAAAVAFVADRPGTKRGDDFIPIGSGAYALATPEPIAPFRLQSHDGNVFDNASLKGSWTFAFFGYTQCPDFCPTTLALFNDVQRELRDRHAATGDIRFIMVSVDPERDPPELLQQYVAAFNRDFIGVTGDPAEIAHLGDSLGIGFAKVHGASSASYQIDHSSNVLLIDPQVRLHGIFAAPHVARDLVAGFVEISRRARRLH